MIIRNSRGALGASSLACVVGSLLPISWAHAQGAQPAAADGQLEEVVVDSGGTDCDSVVAAVKKALVGPLRHVMETGSDPDRIGCASALAALRPQPARRGTDRAPHSDDLTFGRMKK
jgi:glyoxylase-like metal-dependent hydrolase (beta-lactamase superfamily II)